MDELFEFDLSDVDVAAFESVATTPPHSSPPADTANNDASAAGLAAAVATTSDLQIPDTTIYPATYETNQTIDHQHQLDKQEQDKQQQDNNHHPQQTHQHQHYHLHHLHQQPQQQHYPHQLQQQQQQQHHHHHHLLQQQLQSQQPQHQQLQHHVSQQIVSATGQQQPCKILLIPINPANKPSNSGGIKHHLLQLAPGSSPIAMNALKTTASGNKKQIIQMTPKLEESFQTPPPPPTPLNTNMIANEVPKRKPCNCTKSQCLKLYCDCFANGEFCSGCNCTNCFNSLSKEKERQKAIVQCLERNPEAFRPKIGKAVKSAIGEPAPESIERRHTKGCNCKRSGCLKNYCECYEAKILCSNLCKCCGCKNYEESFERKSLMQLANSSSESARGILKNLLPTNNDSSTGKVFSKCFITDRVIHASLACLLQSAQQAEKDGTQPSKIPNLIQTEMGKCLRMIVDSATESSSPKKK